MFLKSNMIQFKKEKLGFRDLPVLQITLKSLITLCYLILGYFDALYEACEYGNLDIVSYLISKGVDMEGKGLPEYYSPLSLTKNRNHKEISELLLNAGAVPRKLNANIKGQNNCTLL